MTGVLRGAWALLFGVALLALGNGLQGTLLGVRASLEQFGSVTTGIVMSAYSVGLLVGSLETPKLITRVGHIRVFAAFASIISTSALVFALFIQSGFLGAPAADIGHLHVRSVHCRGKLAQPGVRQRGSGQVTVDLHDHHIFLHGAWSAAAECGRSRWFGVVHCCVGSDIGFAGADFPVRHAGAGEHKHPFGRYPPAVSPSRRSQWSRVSVTVWRRAPSSPWGPCMPHCRGSASRKSRY